MSRRLGRPKRRLQGYRITVRSQTGPESASPTLAQRWRPEAVAAGPRERDAGTRARWWYHADKVPRLIGWRKKKPGAPKTALRA